MKYLVIYLLHFSTFSCNCHSTLLHSVEAFGTVAEWYWRDYTGIVPTDIIEGGKNEDGASTYIGQINILARYNNEIYKTHTIPVIITNGNRTAIGAYQGTTVTGDENSNLKILCTRNPRNYNWYSRSALLRPGCRYVVVGVEDQVPLYLGKTVHNKQTITGKIFSDTARHYSGLIIPYNGEEYLPDTYQILTYCP